MVLLFSTSQAVTTAANMFRGHFILADPIGVLRRICFGRHHAPAYRIGQQGKSPWAPRGEIPAYGGAFLQVLSQQIAGSSSQRDS